MSNRNTNTPYHVCTMHIISLSHPYHTDIKWHHFHVTSHVSKLHHIRFTSHTLHTYHPNITQGHFYITSHVILHPYKTHHHTHITPMSHQHNIASLSYDISLHYVGFAHITSISHPHHTGMTSHYFHMISHLITSISRTSEAYSTHITSFHICITHITSILHPHHTDITSYNFHITAHHTTPMSCTYQTSHSVQHPITFILYHTIASYITYITRMSHPYHVDFTCNDLI